MPVQNHSYALPQITSALIMGICALFAWYRRQASGAKELLVLFLAGLVWAAFYGLTWLVPTFEKQVLCTKMMFVGTLLVPTLSLVVILRLTERGAWLTRRNYLLMAVWPLVSIFMVWTNDLHGLFFSSMERVTSGSDVLLVWERGPWFWLTFVYSSLIFMVSGMAIAIAFVESPKLYRNRILALAIAMVVPWACNLFSNIGDLGPDNLDLTPASLAFSGIVYTYAVFQYSLLDLETVARKELMEHMIDPFLLQDRYGRVVDMNQAASQLAGKSPAEALGQPAKEVLPLLDHYDSVGRCESDDGEEILNAATSEWFDVRCFELRDSHRQTVGKGLVLRNITERKRAESLAPPIQIDWRNYRQRLGSRRFGTPDWSIQ